MTESSSSNHVHVQGQLNLYFALGVGTQPFSPNFFNCSTNPSICILTSAETSKAPSSSLHEVTPLEGGFAMLQLEGTRASHVNAWIVASASTNFSAKKSTTWFSDKPRSKENFVPSLSTKSTHLRFTNLGAHKQKATTAANVSVSKIICFFRSSPVQLEWLCYNQRLQLLHMRSDISRTRW